MRGDSLRFKLLRSFVRVGELGSITRAASELNIAQPALGLQMRSLEYEFGAQLLIRTSRGVKLTPSGEVVLNWARSIFEQTDKIHQKVRELQGNADVPSVTIGLTPSLTAILARPIVEATLDGNIRVKIVEGTSHSLGEWVNSGRIDIGLGFGSAEAPGLQSVAVMRERLYYLTAPGEGDEPITLAEVLDRPLAVPDDQNSIRPKIEEAASRIDMPVIGTYEIGSMQAAREIARSGRAGAIAPYGGVAVEHRDGSLSVRLIVEPQIERTLYMMRRATESLSDPEIYLSTVLYEGLQSVTRDPEFRDAYTMLDDPRGAANMWESS
ncbi:LysR family transcriptional regulator [Sphingobium fuliginis]|uniref:LysR family transcriptional regulator n=1 Tax=Sphingobium fuliginis (strain ATCC 27551) TaxID=336203 RepID=A0A7M2GN53_SPHSA|nr:LysR family transcriptional regulator [Sphingobium fuliginis]QOT73968.1 LysR family transcriptional regulator [Sphingobium fuliginis]